MGLSQQTVDFRELSSSPNLRLWMPFVQTRSKYPLAKLIYFIDTVESGSRPNGGITEIDEGAISIGGEQIDPKGYVNLSHMPLVPFEFYEECKKGKVRKNDILICKDGALTGKVCYVDLRFPVQEVMVNEHVYILRTKPKISNQKFFFYMIYSTIVQRQIKDLAYRKKGQPGLNAEHIKQIKVPHIPKPVQDQIIAEIEPIEKKITKLKATTKEPQEAINKVFAREFGFDLNRIYSFEKIRHLYISSDFCYRNEDMRSSYRWHKLKELQTILYDKNPYIHKLGKFILSTKNGWSPNCTEIDSRYAVFGVDALSEDIIIQYDNLKYTNETKKNINDFFVKKGDFFVSRGNTTDLVGLASIVNYLETGKDIIFPDLLIRITFDDHAINNNYMAYLFNSIVGRLYFKYSAKGKNQTMVKISSSELTNFYLPIPSLKKQGMIVEEIKIELDKQEEIKLSIDEERNKISELVENAIKFQ